MARKMSMINVHLALVIVVTAATSLSLCDDTETEVKFKTIISYTNNRDDQNNVENSVLDILTPDKDEDDEPEVVIETSIDFPDELMLPTLPAHSRITRALVTASAAAREGAEPVSCRVSHLSVCIKNATDLLMEPRGGIPVNANEIEALCSSMSGVIGCINGYSKKCLHSVLERMLKNEMQEFYDIRDRVCDEQSDFRKNLDKHSACLSKLESSSECSFEFHPLIRKVQSARFGTKIKTVCCSIKDIKFCYYGKAEQTCGKEAKDFVDTTMREMYEKTVARVCGDYNPFSSKKCPDNHMLEL